MPLTIEYVVHLIHRESWQSELSIFESKAEVTSFCLELSKKLDMRYESPAIRVDLTTDPTGEIDHYKMQSSVVGNTNTTSTWCNPNFHQHSQDNVSVTGSTHTVISMNKEAETAAYNELIMMYQNTGRGGT